MSFDVLTKSFTYFQTPWSNRMVEPIRDELKKDHSSLNADGRKRLAKSLKLVCLEEPRWLNVIGPDGKLMQIFHMCPKDELHQWFLGVLGDYIFPAIIYRYTSELRKSHIVKKNGSGEVVPFFSDADILRVMKRIAARLESFNSSDTMLTVSPALTASFMQMYVKGDTKVKLTGERMKVLQLVSPFVFRDLLSQEVCNTTKKHF